MLKCCDIARLIIAGHDSAVFKVKLYFSSTPNLILDYKVYKIGRGELSLIPEAQGLLGK